MSRIVIAGGTGFIGTALARACVEAGHEVVVLTRTPAACVSASPIRQVGWDGRTLAAWTEWLEGAEAVVNLAGRSLNCRFTAEHRREIVSSRVDAIRAIARAIAVCTHPPRVWIQASAIGYYGSTGDLLCDESAPSGTGFLAETCVAWEQAFELSCDPRVRRVVVRLGLVLGRDGGVLAPLSRLTRLFLGGAAGHGRQVISWIHLDDVAAAMLEAVRRETWSGVYNAVAPHPATNAMVMRTLRRILHRPWSPPVPPWAIRIGARLMEVEPSMVLEGCRAEPRRLREAGFAFRHGGLTEALTDLLGAQGNAR